ncbi:MAG TPA: hypothetical protein VHD14_00565 [Pseudolabrys sp.]|nr:hypothetical protein [Pseudolabrys sp.]
MNAPERCTERFAHLRRVNGALRAGEHVSASDRAALCDFVDMTLSGRDFNEAIGAPAPGRGQRSALTVAREAERDRFLRECRAKHFSDKSDLAAARHIDAYWSGYEASPARPSEMKLAECPDRHRGSPREFIWQIEKIGADRIGVDSIRKILKLGVS